MWSNRVFIYIMNNEIKAVVFDLGGVMIDLVPERCVERFRSLGFHDIDKYLGRYIQSGLFLELECGRITAAQFYDRLKPLCPGAASCEELQEAFNSFLDGVPRGRLAALRGLREHKRVLALSNTNPVMFHSAIDRYFRQEGLSFRDYFPEAMLSFEQGCCKPDPEIFRVLQSRFDLDGATTLFIDDSEHNCEAARHCGLQALHLAPGMEVVDVINSLIDIH